MLAFVLSLEQWFFNFLTNLTLLSNEITRFTLQYTQWWSFIQNMKL